MKKKSVTNLIIIFCLFVTSCGGGKESASSIAQKWCALNSKVHKAEGSAKEAAKEAIDKFEKEMEAKYESDKAFMNEIEKEVNKCENASEGR